MREAMIIGEAGQRVARNVKRLRRQQHLSAAAVSTKLGEIGRPIPELGVRRIESCKRRVDIDEIVALATVLQVPADRLAFDDDLNIEVRVVLGSSEHVAA